jgi:hypothetical protein
MSVLACTGVTAFWCPVHGDCTCEILDDGERPSMDDPLCPLHGPTGHPLARKRVVVRAHW